MKEIIKMFRELFDGLNWDVSHPIDNIRLMKCAYKLAEIKQYISFYEFVEIYFNDIFINNKEKIEKLAIQFECYFFAYYELFNGNVGAKKQQCE